MGFGNYIETITHYENCLPELSIQFVFIKISKFFRIVISTSKYSIFNFMFSSIRIQEGTRTGQPMDFTPEVEIEVIRVYLYH